MADKKPNPKDYTSEAAYKRDLERFNRSKRNTKAVSDFGKSVVDTVKSIPIGKMDGGPRQPMTRKKSLTSKPEGKPGEWMNKGKPKPSKHAGEGTHGKPLPSNPKLKSQPKSSKPKPTAPKPTAPKPTGKKPAKPSGKKLGTSGMTTAQIKTEYDRLRAEDPKKAVEWGKKIHAKAFNKPAPKSKDKPKDTKQFNKKGKSEFDTKPAYKSGSKPTEKHSASRVGDYKGKSTFDTKAPKIQLRQGHADPKKSSLANTTVTKPKPKDTSSAKGKGNITTNETMKINQQAQTITQKNRDKKKEKK